MSGRKDYEERKQNRIDRLNEASSKASRESSVANKRSSDLVKDIPFGQPNIIGRPALPNLRKKSMASMAKAIELSEKSAYYAARAESAENNIAISSDDPEAIEKLKVKLAGMEAQREQIKAENKEQKKAGKELHAAYILTNLSGNIKRVKDRIEQLNRLESMPAEIITFCGGEIISDADINRVQIKFDERQSDEVTDNLKRYGFKWAPSEQAWQRLRNPNALYAAKRICGIIFDMKEAAK